MKLIKTTLFLSKTLFIRYGLTSIFLMLSISIFSQELHKKELAWHQTDSTLALLRETKTVWQYNFNTKKGKPFFHPIQLNENSITAHSPKDHPWHLGLWFSWKYINGIDYWEYDHSDKTTTENYKGITEIKNIRIESKADFSCVILLDLEYRQKDYSSILKEQRRIEISTPNSGNQFYIDYTFNFKALERTVNFNRTPLPQEENGESWGGYVGLTFRFNTVFKDPIFLNANQSATQPHGRAASWVYYGFNTKSGPLGVTIFDHPQNDPHPTFWHVTDDSKESLYVLQPASIFQKSYTLEPNETFTLKYRTKFYNQTVSYDALDKDWKIYIQD